MNWFTKVKPPMNLQVCLYFPKNFFSIIIKLRVLHCIVPMFNIKPKWRSQLPIWKHQFLRLKSFIVTGPISLTKWLNSTLCGFFWNKIIRFVSKQFKICIIFHKKEKKAHIRILRIYLFLVRETRVKLHKIDMDVYSLLSQNGHQTYSRFSVFK